VNKEDLSLDFVQTIKLFAEALIIHENIEFEG